MKDTKSFLMDILAACIVPLLANFIIEQQEDKATWWYKIGVYFVVGAWQLVSQEFLKC